MQKLFILKVPLRVVYPKLSNMWKRVLENLTVGLLVTQKDILGNDIH